MVSFGISGIEEMYKKLSKLEGFSPNAFGQAMYQEAQVEMTESKKRVPVDTGTLRASGFVEDPKRQWRNISVTMGYGGAAEAYALIVHEDLEAAHTVGQAKYLESVLQESAPHMAARIAKRIDLNKAL